MRTPMFRQWTRLTALVAVLLTATACGKDDDKKKKKGADTTIESAEIDGAGNATFKYSSTSSLSDFYCRIDTADGEGEWYACNGGSTSYNIPEGAKITFWVKNGPNGRAVQREMTYAEQVSTEQRNSADPADNAGAYQQDDGVWNLTGLYTGLLPVGNEHGFAVPEGKRIIRYAVQEGIQNSLTVFKLVDPSDVLSQVSHLTPCGGGAFPGEVVRGRSTYNGQVSTYCKYHPTFQGLKHFEQKEMAANHIEIGNEAGGPLDFVSVSVFTSALDQVYTKRLFVKHCGIPGDYDQNAVTPDGLALPVGTPLFGNYGQLPPDFFTLLANGQLEEPVSYRGFRPSGFKVGGTFYNLPVLNQYFAGLLPERAAFHWCIRDVNFVSQSGIGPKRLFVGTFEVFQASNTGGPETAKRVEYHIIQEVGSRFGYEFANAAAQSALSSLYPTTPQRQIPQQPGYPGVPPYYGGF